jgi:hypothetical protein
MDSGSPVVSVVEIVLLDGDMRSVEEKQRTDVKFFMITSKF